MREARLKVHIHDKKKKILAHPSVGDTIYGVYQDAPHCPDT